MRSGRAAVGAAFAAATHEDPTAGTTARNVRRPLTTPAQR